MKRKTKISLLLALALVVLAGTAVAGSILRQKAELVSDCDNCPAEPADLGTPRLVYSVLPDFHLPAGYEDGAGVKSQILNHNAVYTLNTLDTLVNGHVVDGTTRFVRMHFYSPVEGQFAGHVLPACWAGSGGYDQNQAVNWSVFSDNSLPFTKMVEGKSYPGRARMDFNVRNTQCDREIYRYYLVWPKVCITRTSTGWVATSDTCGAMINYGTATLRGQGGQKKETVNYGDWRLPFKLVLSPPTAP